MQSLTAESALVVAVYMAEQDYKFRAIRYFSVH
jgi:hypothetical protein